MKKTFRGHVPILATVSVLLFTLLPPVSAQVLYVSDNNSEQDPFAPSISEVSMTGGVTPFVTSGLDGTVRGLALDNSGSLYAAVGNSIDKISSNGTVTTFATLDSHSGTTVSDYMAFDSSGDLYVSQSLVYASGSSFISKIAPDGTVTSFGSAITNVTNGLAVDSSGNVYVAVSNTSGAIPISSIQEFGPDGTFLGNFITGINGELTDLAFDQNGNLYGTISGYLQGETLVPGTLDIITGQGVDQVASLPGFPNAFAFGSDGNIYVTDGDISEVTAGGDVSTLATGFGNPQGIVFSDAGPVQTVPEPSTWALLALGAGAIIFARLRRKSA